MNGPVTKIARCAIYTRKSTEHNLDLAFNSLDAQREACEAYVKCRTTVQLPERNGLGATHFSEFGRHFSEIAKRRDIVVVDNVPFHKVGGVEEAIQAVGASLRYLPKYSPDLNPIGCCFIL